jgi:transposase
MEGHPDSAREVLVPQGEAITQPPAPFHVTPRGFAGPNLLAMVLFEKFGQHHLSTGRANVTPAKASS